MSKIINIRSLEEIGTAAQEFVQYISSSDLQSNIFAFFGQMGAGKTTFIKAICKELGVADAVNSPTFTIVNEYRAAKGFPIYHFDFYRINKLSEAIEIGLYDYLDSQNYYIAPVKKESRSLMNVTFVTGDADLDKKFASEAAKAGLKNLKGHRSVGGMRASIYNAMPQEGVVKLIEFMKDFAKNNAK